MFGNAFKILDLSEERVASDMLRELEDMKRAISTNFPDLKEHEIDDDDFTNKY